MSIKNQKVGVIVGTDHYSFPSAVANCISAGISTVFHHVGITGAGADLPAQWGCLDTSQLGRTSVNSLCHPFDLISFVQALPARYAVSDCCFAGISNSLDDPNQPGWLDRFRLELGNTEALRVVFVPFHSLGIWRITGREVRGGFGSLNFETQQLPERTQRGGSKYEQTLVVSPGDCRRHNFCVLDMLAGTVSCLMCQ